MNIDRSSDCQHLAFYKLAASGRSDFKENTNWLRQHRNEHVGYWVALRDGQLVDKDISRITLQNRLQQTNQADSVLFVCIRG